jgi:hypothetical protein
MTAVLEPRTNTEPGVTFLELEITNRCQLTCSKRVAALAVSHHLGVALAGACASYGRSGEQGHRVSFRPG